MAVEAETTSAPAGFPPSPPPKRTRAIQLVLGLAVAVAILLGAWLVTGRTGMETLGRGGVNQRLLPKVGEVAPDFTTQDVLGRPVALSDFRGQPVWLMFWGSWCAPCRAEFPDVERAYKQLRADGVALLGVSVREPGLAAASYAGQNDATFLVLTDEDESDTGAGYPLFNVPTHIFIDADGVIRSIVLAEMNEATALREGRALLRPAAAAD